MFVQWWFWTVASSWVKERCSLSLLNSERQLWQPLTWWAIGFSQEIKKGEGGETESFSSSNLYFNALLSWSVLNTERIMMVHAVSCLSLSGFSVHLPLEQVTLKCKQTLQLPSVIPALSSHCLHEFTRLREEATLRAWEMFHAATNPLKRDTFAY